MSAELAVKPVDIGITEQSELNQQFVTFNLNGELFAVEMTPVQEIIRVPAAVRVPLAPVVLDGLANLRGKILPIISLRRVFGFADPEHDDATRALVIDLGIPLGFVVDKVSSVINIEPSQLESVDGIRSTVDSRLLSSVIRLPHVDKLIMVLNFAQLIDDEFQQLKALSANPALYTQDIAADALDEEHSDEQQLVSFKVAGQEYAINIRDVQEIVQVPEHVVQVPKVAGHVLGMMTLRERLLPLVSLRHMFNLPMTSIDERSRVVVVAVEKSAVGIVTDSVSEVLRVPESLIDPVPKLFTSKTDFSEIKQICRLEQGHRLVSVIDVDTLFQLGSISTVLTEVKAMQDEQWTEHDDAELLDEDEEQVVVFHLAAGEFGVPIHSVQEIVRIPAELTPVPKAPEFIEGIINLRGMVLPVIDQRKRLGLPEMPRHDRQRIMVFLFNGVRTGFIVDAVTEVLKIAKKCISVSPHLSSEQAQLLGRVANLEHQQRIIQLIEPAHLMNTTEQLDVGTLVEK